MQKGTDTGSSRLFMVVALVLTASLVLGLLGIGGLVMFRLISGPTEVAMPPLEAASPTPVLEEPDVPTPSPLPSATPTRAPTPTLVMASTTPSPTVEGPENGGGQNGPGMSSPSPDSPGMPQTGLGLLETVGLGLALIVVVVATRAARHTGVQK
ncbi:MAG: hypothetical protein GTO63_26480 [Anaerolineae bacterium]|nr:hypothetical protein [Anaerolineae bacterium]NIN98283.1 hypothetical protein [Anaerolineae bacterium]NIQ81212.1 hypothetical protein [Anaerolineae bacterium]